MPSSSLPEPSTIIFALHILVLHPHVYLGIKHRTYRFLFLVGIGIVLEVTGQIFHTLHRPEPFTDCATVFLCAAIHSLWVHVLGIYSQKWEAYGRFLVAEIIATSVVGGGAVAAWKGHNDIGAAIVKAGMGWFSGSIIVLWGASWFPSFRKDEESSRDLKSIERFFGGLASATLCVLIRVWFLITGQDGWLRCGMVESESGATFDGGIVLLAVLILTVNHPGQLYRAESWMAIRETTKYQTETCEQKLQDEKDFAE